eukprot:516299_1
MKLFSLLRLTFACILVQMISSRIDLYGDEFTNYVSKGWDQSILNCNDSMPCTINCLGDTYSCRDVLIYGPINSSLTINCDARYTCEFMIIHSENSTTLTINVHNEDFAFSKSTTYTPHHTLLPNTFITCSIIEDQNPSGFESRTCGIGHNIYSPNGWEAVEWSYAGTASWALAPNSGLPDTMHCGNDYADVCSVWVADGFYYRCKNSTSVCDYDRSDEPQHTAHPTAVPTPSPTNPGDLAAEYTTNTTLLSSTTYSVVTPVEIGYDVFFTVPGDVDIVFKGDYRIGVFGTLNVGCDSIDTSNSNEIGIASESELISIYNEDNSTQKGTIYIYNGGSAFFCNTRFTNLFRIYHGGFSAPSYLFVDNCEFDNIVTSLGFFSSQCGTTFHWHHISDSKFMNCDTGIETPMCVNIENNVFESVYAPISCAYDATINNNTFGSVDHSGFRALTTCSGSPNITLNTFINWQDAILIEGNNNDPVNVFYNAFIDNTNAILIGTRYVQQINYNNFINNSYSIYYADCGYDTLSVLSCAQPNCGYNYYGTSSNNQSIISSQIFDLCVGGNGHGLVTWWPWYIEAIDFNSLPTTLEEHTFKTITCAAADGHPEITGNKLAPYYPYNTTLTSINSPYYIVSGVRTETDATIYVESGVQLIFADNYDIQISGALIMGCDAIDTVNNHTIGIISNAELISASSIDTTQRGRIVIRRDASGSFCNTKFENMNSGIHMFDTNSNLFIDNCEFYTNYIAVAISMYHQKDSVLNQITDSKFLYNTQGLYDVSRMNITNNIFQNAGDQTAISLYSNVNLFRNTFTYDNFTTLSKNGEGLYLKGLNVNVTFNTFDRYPTAIQANWDDYGGSLGEISMFVAYNEFIENNVAIDLDTAYPQRIHYNNFIQNTWYNIRSRNDEDQA